MPAPNAAPSPFRESVDSRSRNTGLWQATTRFRNSEFKRRELMAESYIVADKIVAAGRDAYLASTTQMVGEVDGRVYDCPPFRDIRIIPYIANRHRRETTAIIEGYRASSAARETPRLRYYVASTGDLIEPGGPLRRRHQESTRRITKFFHYARQEWDIELLFRSTEIDLNEVTYCVQLHHNLLYSLHKKLSPKEWGRFLSELHGALGSVGRDCGEIVSMEAVVRYSMKPIKNIESAPINVIRWLVDELRGAKMTAKYGRLAAFASAHADETYVLDLETGRKDWIPKGKRKRTEKALNVTDHDHKPKFKPECLIVGRTTPIWRGNIFSQSFTLFRGWTITPETPAGINSMSVFADRQRESRAAALRNGAPAPEIQIKYSEMVLAAESDEEAEAIDISVLSSIVSVPSSIQSDRLAIDKLLSLPVVDNVIHFPSPRPRWIDGVQMHPKTGQPMVKPEIYYPAAEIVPAPANDYTEMDIENELMDELQAAETLRELRVSYSKTPAGRRHFHLTGRWSDILEDEEFEPTFRGAELRFMGFLQEFDEKNPHLLGLEPVPEYAITHEYPGLCRRHHAEDLSAAA